MLACVFQGKRFNDSYIYDIERREWRKAEIAGTPPHPRSHHTASLVEFDEEDDGDAEKKVFIIGGYGGHGATRDFSMDVHVRTVDPSYCPPFPPLAISFFAHSQYIV